MLPELRGGMPIEFDVAADQRAEHVGTMEHLASRVAKVLNTLPPDQVMPRFLIALATYVQAVSRRHPELDDEALAKMRDRFADAVAAKLEDLDRGGAP